MTLFSITTSNPTPEIRKKSNKTQISFLSVVQKPFVFCRWSLENPEKVFAGKLHLVYKNSVTLL